MKIKLKETKKLSYDKVVKIFFEVGFLKKPSKTNLYNQSIQEAFKNSQYVISAWDEKQLVGFVRVLSDKTIFATIWNMIVKPEYQNKGIGELLVKQIFKKYNKHAVFLIADQKVKGFYEKMGFKAHSSGMYLVKGYDNCSIYN